MSVRNCGEYTYIINHRITPSVNGTPRGTQEMGAESAHGVTASPLLLQYLYHISLNNRIIFSDGSSDKGHATYAIVIQPPYFECSLDQVDSESLLHFAGKVDGSSDDTHSYRAELAGILAAIDYTNKVCAQYRIESGKCALLGMGGPREGPLAPPLR
jgi:hypothetical protein